MNTRSYLPGLDLVRIWGILTVLIYHYWVETAPLSMVSSPPFWGQEQLVQMGVYGMTLLSGACLSWQEKGRDWSLRRYLRGRFLGIYPLYWSCFFPVFFYSDLFCGNNRDVAPWKLLLSLAGVDGYFQSFTPTFYKVGEWYLGCILFLYALFPLVWKFVRRWGPWTAAGIGFFFWMSCCLVCRKTRLYSTVSGQLPLFLAGICLGCYLPAIRTAWVPAAGTAFLLAALGCPDYCVVTASSAAVFVLLFSLGQNRFFLTEKGKSLLRWLSRQCFGVFLVHHLAITLVLLPVLRSFPAASGSWLLGLLLLIPGSFGLSWVLGRLSGRLVHFFDQTP